MTKNEIFEAITNNPVFHLATVEGDQPRVRAMFLYKADDSGIIFHTSVNKDVNKQITDNNRVELCFSCNGTQIRISGVLERVNDNALLDEIVEHPSRKFLKAWKDNGIFDDFNKAIAIYCLKNGTASLWTMETNFAPKVKVRL